jgi:hypothetical protein
MKLPLGVIGSRASRCSSPSLPRLPWRSPIAVRSTEAPFRGRERQPVANGLTPHIKISAI